MPLIYSLAVLAILSLWLALLSVLLLRNYDMSQNYSLLVSDSLKKRNHHHHHPRKELNENITISSSLGFSKPKGVEETSTGWTRHNSIAKYGHELPPVKTAIPETIYVLVLAYQRSGSSFLGEILSARRESMYIFEPLIEVSNKRRIFSPEVIRNAVMGMYNCNSSILDIIGTNRTAELQMIRKVGTEDNAIDYVEGCVNSRIRVIKTIRLRMNVAKLLLDDPTLPVRIVHLVRDPRAMLNSINSSDTWSSTSRTAQYQCQQLREDIAVGSVLAKDKYVRVRYEDLVKNPLEVAVKLYAFLHIPLHTSLTFYLATHTETERFYKFHHRKAAYFSTYRKSTYDHNSWMKTMSKTQRKEIEKCCSDVMDILAYHPLQ